MPSTPQSTSENTTRRQSFLDYGGVNSLNNFASSLQRAQTYLEVTLQDSVAGMDNISPCTSRESPDAYDSESALLGDEPTAGVNADYGASANTKSHRSTDLKGELNSFHFPAPDHAHHADHADHMDHAACLASDTTGVSVNSAHARRRRESSLNNPGPGRSTGPQTVFNAVNTLMGVAMLSLPFALRLSGWIPGLVILGLCAWVTSKTAKILGSVLRKHKNVHSYADIAYLYGGSKFLAFATTTFAVDLIGASLSLILIFSDSFSTLFPAVHSAKFKIAITTITFLFSFLPLSLVSLISLVGIICTVGIFVMIVLGGLAGSDSPGSLLSPAHTSLWPSSSAGFLLSLGIYMAPWGGHPVFPELYRDMRHPSKYNKCCDVTFLATIFLDILIGAVGYLMFGDSVKDSITKNIIAKTEYPDWIRSLICVFLGLLPVCKLALVTRPVISVYESHLSLNKRTSRWHSSPGPLLTCHLADALPGRRSWRFCSLCPLPSLHLEKSWRSLAVPFASPFA
ncbi:hypothetical protein JCM33374_g277 [Metschnikowia sp. JCM 33374]|nr:hypothetical protein JCM33374_g277 [Metschnikowia sp. JCM 33374]